MHLGKHALQQRFELWSQLHEIFLFVFNDGPAFQVGVELITVEFSGDVFAALVVPGWQTPDP